MTEDIIMRVLDNSITGVIAILLVWRIEKRLTELVAEVRAMREALTMNNFELKKVKEWLLRKE